MIKIYGKNNCGLCDDILNIAKEKKIEYEFIKDDNVMMELAIELNNIGKLIQQKAPLILKDGNQITHEEFKTLT